MPGMGRAFWPPATVTGCKESPAQLGFSAFNVIFQTPLRPRHIRERGAQRMGYGITIIYF